MGLFRGLKKKDDSDLPEEVIPEKTNWEDPLDFSDLERHVDRYNKECTQANRKDLENIERGVLNTINKAKKKM